VTAANVCRTDLKIVDRAVAMATPEAPSILSRRKGNIASLCIISPNAGAYTGARTVPMVAG
jgi:hypothetical protein